VKIGKLNHGIHGNHGTSSNPWVSSMVFSKCPEIFGESPFFIPIFHPHPEIIEIASEHATTIKNDLQKSPLFLFMPGLQIPLG
jgi:hypothetical protein